MASYTQENDIVGGGLGGFGGGYGLLILLFLFFAIFCGGGLFGRRDGRGDGDGFGGCGCGPEKWFIDRDIIEQGCKDRAQTDADGEKTRGLIVHEAERNEDRYVRNLEMENSNLKQTMAFDAKIGGLYGMVEKGFCKTDAEIAHLSCELPKRPPVFSRCDTVCLERLPDRGGCGCDGFR